MIINNWRRERRRSLGGKGLKELGVSCLSEVHTENFPTSSHNVTRHKFELFTAAVGHRSDGYIIERVFNLYIYKTLNNVIKIFSHLWTRPVRALRVHWCTHKPSRTAGTAGPNTPPHSETESPFRTKLLNFTQENTSLLSASLLHTINKQNRPARCS